MRKMPRRAGQRHFLSAVEGSWGVSRLWGQRTQVAENLTAGKGFRVAVLLYPHGGKKSFPYRTSSWQEAEEEEDPEMSAS